MTEAGSLQTDDAEGETTEIVWEAELAATVLSDTGYEVLAKSGTDDPAVFGAYLRALRWGSASAADRDLFRRPSALGKPSKLV